ncbi:MAG: TerB family tellurite resistance protein [Proteobacteria bacterium]|nr:TerB family tellurite resistance protein [Pseudomonadota bacterium]
MRPDSWQPHSELDPFLGRVDDAPLTEENLLLPLVFVAWADGRIQPHERHLIQQIARDSEFLPGQTREVLRRWLTDRPTDDEFGHGFRRLVEFLQQRDRATEVHGVLRDHLEELCGRVAASRSSGSPLPVVTDAEADALDDVHALLWMAKTPSWGQLDAWLDGSIESLSTPV